MLYFFDLDPDSDFRPARPKIIRIGARFGRIETVVSEHPMEFSRHRRPDSSALADMSKTGHSAAVSSPV
jgi:hypothetical protein